MATPPLRLNAIPAVDLRLLSQSELHSLSNCSNSSSPLDRCDDVVIPKIDRSVFNESAGSRKQTYSRLRLAPADSSKTTIHRRTHRLRASNTPPLVNDPEQAENSQIICLLKELFKSDSTFQDLDRPLEVDDASIVVVAPELLDSELVSPNAPELLNSDEDPQFVSPKVPALLNSEAPELIGSEMPQLLDNTKAPELLDITKAPEFIDNTEAPELIDNTKAPELIDNTKPLELIDNTNAPKLLDNTNAPELLDNTNAPELLDNTKAPELIDNTKASELLDTEAPELLKTEEAPELLSTETKRKRGRPRKLENAVSTNPPVAKRMRNSAVKKVIVYDDDRDKGILNSIGLKVNLTNLGTLEDPYGPEIRRRTEGLSTSDELLGFLTGLKGQWGTTRKKRRVVDASDFGDALPKGWKLSLCIKKKEGHVWLFCRRYISPSGRQFESCKDISMYLLSILGEENMDKPNNTHINSSDDSALKGCFGNAANLSVQEDLERTGPVHNPSTPPVSLPTDCEKQFTPGIVGPINIHVDVFKCLKCFLIFKGKDDLFDHKSVSHKDEKSQLDSPIPDWSIVIGGIFRCNFCHETFNEINQYNGHIGTHVTNENTAAEKTIDPVSISAEIDHDMGFVIESKKDDEVVHDLDMNEDVLVQESGDGIGNKCVNEKDVPETDKDSDVSVSVPRSECDLDQDIVARSNVQDSGFKTRVQYSSTCEENDFQADNNDTRVCSSVDKLTTEKGKVVYNESSSGFFHGISNGQDAVSETRVHTSSICEDVGFRENINDMHMSSSFDEIRGNVGTGVLTSSIYEDKGFRENITDTHMSSSFDEIASEKGNDETRVHTSSICGDKGFGENITGTHMSSSFDEMTSEKGNDETKVHNSSICEDKGFQENINNMHMSSSFDEMMSEKGNVVNNESSSGVFHGLSDGQDIASETRVQTFNEEKGFRENINDTHIFSSFSELTSEKGKVVNKDSSSGIFHNRLGFNEGQMAETKKLSESESLSLFPNTFKTAVDNSSLKSSKKQDSFKKLGFVSAHQGSHGFDKNRYFYNTSNSQLGEQYEVRNSQFDRYGKKEDVNKEYFHIENDDKSGEANLDEFQVFQNNGSANNEIVSLGSSSQNGVNANVMNFNAGKNIEFCSLVPPGNNQAFGFQDGDKFEDIFGDKFDENIHELSLAFGNPNSIYEDTVGVNEQKKVGLSCPPVVSSKINDTFDVQTDLRMVNNSMVQDLKRGNETRGFQNNGNSVYPGRTWGDFKSDEFRNSEDRKFMMSSGSNQMWKTPQGSHLQSGLVNSHAQIQTPNFHSFDIMSQKAQDGLFRHNERYNPTRSEPVEFRFLTDRSEHDPNALQSGSRVFPYAYNSGIEQGIDPTFWMGKNAMMPNMNGRNLVTSVCSWCRNQFYLPAMAIHQQTQAGAGSLCQNCSAGISGQANML